MSYAGLTKGITALGVGDRAGRRARRPAEALIQELRESQPALLPYLARLPTMFPKAYRWVAEMEEIADFLAGDVAGATALSRHGAALRAAGQRRRDAKPGGRAIVAFAKKVVR